MPLIRVYEPEFTGWRWRPDERGRTEWLQTYGYADRSDDWSWLATEQELNAEGFDWSESFYVITPGHPQPWERED
jgi:hypothetical protein